MSVQAMSWAIDHSRHKGGSLLVLLMIANHAKSDGSGAWPSTETLAKECRMSERQVRRIIDGDLEGSGELVVIRRPGRPHIYDLPSVRAASTPDKMSDVGSVNPGHPPRQPRTSTASTPDIAMSDEPKATEKQPKVLSHTAPPSAPVDWGEVAEAKTFLDSLNGSVPEGFPIEQIYDPALWGRLDNLVFTSGSAVDLFEALAKYLAWWATKASSRRHRNVARGFSNWVREDVDRAKYRAANGGRRR